jgi:hypothetical protein
MSMKTTIILFAVCSIVAGSTSPTVQFEKTWRQKLLLLQSTRADVEKVFGKPIGKHNDVTYNLEDGTLYISYYGYDHCKPRYGLTADWNIPEWTVTEITYLPDNPTQFASLSLDLRKFRMARLSPNVPSMISYVSEEQGIEYTLEGDGLTLHSIRYFPGKQYTNLRCSKSGSPN